MKTLKKQNETLKAWNGTEINFIWKSQFGLSWNWNLGMIPKIWRDKTEVRARFPPTSNDKILIIQFLMHPDPELGPSSY